MTVPDLPGLHPPISTTAVRVRWLVLDAVEPEMWAELAALLDDAERARADRFHFDRDRQAYIAAHALARTLLSAEAPRPPATWRFTEGVHGKPEVVREPGVPPLRFNLSHTHGLVAVALTLAHDVGIDVETIDPKRAGLEFAERVFAPAEVALLRAASREALPDTFFAIWSLKEVGHQSAGGRAFRAARRLFGVVGSACGSLLRCAGRGSGALASVADGADARACPRAGLAAS